MGAQRKGSGRASEDTDELSRQPLQAILLADSFTTKFRPITLERPKVLLPLVNTPMIDYTLAWLESAGVEEVFVFCCAHSKQVIDYLENSEWKNQQSFSINTIESHNSISAGDALRLIYERNVNSFVSLYYTRQDLARLGGGSLFLSKIHGDFVLISGDTVSNMSLSQVLQEHKERRKKDSNAIMTMVIKQSKPSPITRQTRLGADELFMAIDPNTNQLLYFEDRVDCSKGSISLDKTFLVDNPCISMHNDKQDCYIDICSPEVLSLFTDNFDYQHLRRHFVKGLLVDDIMGYKIYTYEIHSSYAARVDNFRSYDTISKDIIQRWTYPYVPDVKFCGIRASKLERLGIYRSTDIEVSRFAQVGPFAAVGYGTKIGSNTRISNSVIGEGCTIGSDVLIEGSYIWNNVTIEDGCKLRHSIVCDGVVMKSGTVLEPGVILSFKVVIGQQFVVPAYSKVSLLQQPMEEDSDEELEYADNNSGNASTIDATDKLGGWIDSTSTEVWPGLTYKLGASGIGYIWSISDGGHEDEWRYSVAPIPADKFDKILQDADDDQVLFVQDDGALPAKADVKSDMEGSISEDDNEDSREDYLYFEKEVEATFLRAVHENIQVDHVILEVNALRLSYNMQAVDCAGAIFYSMMRFALESSHNSDGDRHRNAATVITTWKKLLLSFLHDLDEKIEVIMKFEEMCLESAKEFSPIFSRVLHLLYEEDILEEDAILRWADEKEGADESDKVFVKKSENFLQWLREASEESE